MSFSHEYNFPVFINTGNVATSGRLSTLQPGQLAVVKTDGVVATGNLGKYDAVKIVQGSLHTKDKLNQYFGGMQKPDEGPAFLTTDVLEFQKVMPRGAVSEQWALGWDRISSDTLKFKCNTEYRFRVKVWGEDVYGTFLRPLVREIGFRTECCTENCSSDCDVDYLSAEKYTKKLAELIENDVELKWFVKADMVSSAYAITTPTHKFWTLSLCDDGSPIALAKVQAQAGTFKVERISRTSTNSTYQVVDVAAGLGPDDFVPASEIALADCGVCPDGYTTVGETNFYIVQRVVTPTTDLDDASAKQTYATAVATAYDAQATGKFLSLNGGVATIEVKLAVADGTISAPVANTSDVVFLARTEAAKCVAAANDPIAWVEGDTRYKTSRTLKMTLPKDCGGADREADMIAFYADNPLVKTAPAVTTSGECDDIYEIEQWSDNLLEDGCYSPDQAKYSELPSFDGFTWTPDAESAVYDADVKTGVIITTAYEDTKFGGCSFWPKDYYSVRPLSLEVTALVGGPGDTTVDPCAPVVPSKKIRFSSMPTQSGEWAIREYIKASVYRINGEFYGDPRMREVFDSLALSVIERDKNYIVYTFKVRQHRIAMNHTADFSPEIVEMRFFSPVDVDTSDFETLLSEIASKSGVSLEVR